MRKFLMSAFVVLAFVPGAFAESDAALDSYDPTTSQVFSYEQGPIYTPERAATPYSMKTSGIGDIIKRVIGDVIRAEVLDRDQGRGGYRRQVTCYAENRRGEVFRASGNRPQQVQARAIDKCYAYSRDCRARGCQLDR